MIDISKSLWFEYENEDPIKQYIISNHYNKRFWMQNHYQSKLDHNLYLVNKSLTLKAYYLKLVSDIDFLDIREIYTYRLRETQDYIEQYTKLKEIYNNLNLYLINLKQNVKKYHTLDYAKDIKDIEKIEQYLMYEKLEKAVKNKPINNKKKKI